MEAGSGKFRKNVTNRPHAKILPFSAGILLSREALIKSLSDFILGFLCNARNNSTQIASYLRQQSCIGLLSQDKLALSLHIKAPSFYS
ncbi:hypothetical protein, partial [uncultured Dialister sp.]|uniref:hypothetical protein n=1 Tax=uncultured Dialister sp. TaxID=278064 RepID=UPI0025F49D8D